MKLQGMMNDQMVTTCTTFFVIWPSRLFPPSSFVLRHCNTADVDT